MTDPKVIWNRPDNGGNNEIELIRYDNATYSLAVSDFVETAQASMTREELRGFYKALKVELGIAGG